MKKAALVLVALALILGGVGQAESGLIRVDAVGPGWQIQALMPLGQTFTAEDSSILLIGFDILDMNPSYSTDHSVSISLYQGAGAAGPLLGSRTIDGITDSFAGFVHADFSSVTLAVGETYTAYISDTTPRWGVQIGQDNPYANGQATESGAMHADLDLHIEVVPNSTPEPASLTMLGIGITCMAGYGWRRRKQPVPS